MQNSKLIDLARSLSPREWRAFLRQVASPYFNRNADVLRLATWLDAFAPGFEHATRAAAHAHLFPAEAPDEAQLNHLMSFLLKLAEDFLALELFWKEPSMSERYLLRSLLDRGLEKHYRLNLEKARRALELEQKHSVSHFYEHYSLEILEAERFARNSPRLFNESVQKATDNLDAFYLLEKLRRTCYMYTSQAILATPYNLQLVEEICRFVGNNLETLASPAIEAYYRIFQLLTKDNPHEDFQALKALLFRRSEEFNAEDLADVYQYAINFCNIQINQVQENYQAEAFDLYTNGVDSGMLMQDGALSPWHFKNIINLALKLKKYAWTEQFIKQHNTSLAPEFQLDALHYNLALLYYHTQRLPEALEYLNKVEFTDIHYSLGAKVMLCQIYYQTDNYDALESLLHAFNTFLRRNKLIAEQNRQAFLHFVLWMRKILRSRPDQFPAMAQELEKMRVVGKDWLLQILSLR
jgi:hypothetical protein